jgi:hypothetical protein
MIGISFTGDSLGGYTFTITTASQNDGNSGKDAGILQGSEIQLNGSINGTYPGTFAGYDDEDWYILNLTDGDAVTVNVKPALTERISVDLYKILGSSTYDEGSTSSVNGENVTLHSCYNTDGAPLKMQIRVSDSVDYGKRNDYNITLQILHQNDGNSGKDAGENHEGKFFRLSRRRG